MSKLNIGNDLYLKGRIGWRGLSKDEYLKTGDYKIINATALMDGYIDWDNCGFISKERYEESFEIMLQENDILISKDGTLGKIGFVKNLSTPCTIASGIFLLRNTIPEKLDFDYLYHVLKSDIFKDFIRRNKADGSTINHLYQRDLANFEIDLPDIETQKKISNILNELDNKVTNNNAINSELEAMAKTIYDYWFLQFEFPDENGKPYKSSGGKMVWNEELKRDIPDGWEVKSIFDIADVTYGFPLSTEYFSNIEGLPVIRIRDIPDNSISAYTSEKVDEKYLTKTKDLLIGMDGNFHMNFWSRKGDCVNQRIVRVRTSQTISVLQIYFEIMPFIKAKEQNTARSTVGHLSDKDMKEIRILVPNSNRFYNIFDDILSKICLNKNENQELASLRDFLLPLLMNGQVTFKKE